MTATTAPTIRFKVSTSGARWLSWQCSCGAWSAQHFLESRVVASADAHASSKHPNGSTVELGGLL